MVLLFELAREKMQNNNNWDAKINCSEMAENWVKVLLENTASNDVNRKP